MSPWDILGIEPTDEIASIKRAYAKKLKIHHPEDDPEGYQRLREAYDLVIKQQKKGERNRSVPIILEETVTVHNLETVPNDIYYPSPFLLDNWDNSFDEKEDPVDEFLTEVKNLYGDFPSRIDIERWEELLNSDILWNIELKTKISVRLLRFFQDHSYLPKNIWELIEASFNWNEEFQEHDISEEISDEFIAYYQLQIYKYNPSLSYFYLKNVENIDYDAFLYYREKMLASLMLDDFEDAEEWFQKAYTIFEDDPDLLRLYGGLCYRTGRYEEAVQVFRKCLEINPDDLDARFSFANVLYYMKDTDESAVQCEKILSSHPRHIDILHLYGKNLFSKGELNKSREIFKRLEKKTPNDIEVITYLASIHAQMANEKKKKIKENKYPDLNELKKELYKPNFIQKILLFLSLNIRVKVIFLTILSIILWNKFYEMISIHPLLFIFGTFLFLLIRHFEFFSLITPSEWFMFGLLMLTILSLLKELKKAYRAVRY
ncbi:J domain-containing protein [Metabacillus fastidiosus]|uniref:J domain-containing protein n=1 Tax=Metabacillus fastidiosus TaxID=1458 RepID=UPI003D28E06C